MVNKIFDSTWHYLECKCKSPEEKERVKQEYMAYLIDQYACADKIINGKGTVFTHQYMDMIINGETMRIQSMSLFDFMGYLHECQIIRNFYDLSAELSQMVAEKQQGVSFPHDDYIGMKHRVMNAFRECMSVGKADVRSELSAMLWDLDFIYG